MIHRLLAALLLLSLAAPLCAIEAPAVSRSYSFRVSVDEQGRVGMAEPAGELPAELAPALLGVVKKTAFEPARIDGRAVPSRTMVHVLVRFEGGYDEMRAVLVDVLDGGKLEKAAHPRYPRRALRADVGAEVWATLSFHADGSLDRKASQVDSVALVGDGPPREDGMHQKSFEAVVTAAMKKWTLLPDEVNGKPIAMTVRVPTRFCPSSLIRVRGCGSLWPRASLPDPSPEPRDPGIQLAKIKPGLPTAGPTEPDIHAGSPES